MPTARISDENWEKLELIALDESNKEGRIITVGKLLNAALEKLLDKELAKRKIQPEEKEK